VQVATEDLTNFWKCRGGRARQRPASGYEVNT
jgi:hypothetical protein